jgi:hypothetical protein
MTFKRRSRRGASVYALSENELVKASSLRDGIVGLLAEVMRRMPDILILVFALAVLLSLLGIGLLSAARD